MKKSHLTLILSFLFFIPAANCQILKDIAKAKDKIAGITLDKLSRDPITTSFKDVDKKSILPESTHANATYADLHAQPFNPETGFTLEPGYYEAELMSFCIKAGTYMPTRGSGRFYAEMKGPKADIFETILYALHTDRSLENRNMTTTQFAQRRTDRSRNGYKLIDFEYYRRNGEWQVAGIWEKAEGRTRINTLASLCDVKAAHETNSAAGYELIDWNRLPGAADD